MPQLHSILGVDWPLGRWLSADLQPELLGGGVGTMADWIDTGLSDHVPVWADLTR